MQTLLTVIVTWLAANFGLPAIYEHPRVELVSEARMAEIRHSRLTSTRPEHLAPEPGRAAAPRPGGDVYAIYDDVSRTIYLPEKWTGTSPAEVSLLVHELVHHLQKVGGLAYACPEAREKPAYQAQTRWLELFGKELTDEFEIDPMTVLVRTNCMH